MKIVLTEPLTDLKWSDCQYLPIKSYLSSQQMSPNTFNNNTIQINQYSSHQSYYAQDTVPQYEQSYIHSQLSTHYHSEFYHQEQNQKQNQNETTGQQKFHKTIYYNKLYVSTSINTHTYKKSQTLKPNMCQQTQLHKIEYLISGYCRQTYSIPTDIINLFIHYHGTKSRNSIIIRSFSNGFNSINYKTLSIIHYAPNNFKKRNKYEKSIMRSVGYNVILSDDIIKSYLDNFSHVIQTIKEYDEFNVVFFETKTYSNNYMYHVVIFNESIAFQLNLPNPCIPIYNNRVPMYLYSSKYGFLVLTKHNIQCFSLKHWKWSILTDKLGPTLHLSKLKSYYCRMIGDGKFLMRSMARGRNKRWMIFDSDTLNVCYIPIGGSIGRRTLVCYDDILYKRLYVFSVPKHNNKKLLQYYDMTTRKWNDVRTFKRINLKFDWICLDNVDKNLLYVGLLNNIMRVDLRTGSFSNTFYCDW